MNPFRKSFRNLSTALFLFLLSSSIYAQTIENPKVIAINPGHFPNDKLGGTGTNGKDATEYKLNLKITEYVQKEFENDSRFIIVIPKDTKDFKEGFSDEVFNKQKMNYISQRMKLKFPYVRGFKHGGNPKATPPERLKLIYSTRLVLEERADIIIDPHHDAPDSAKDEKVRKGLVLSDSGHCVLISPYASNYPGTKNLASCLAEELDREQTISTRMVNDSLPDFPQEIQEDRIELREKGIVFRKLLPELGNYKINAKKPVIMVEYNFARKVSIKDDKYFKKMANATYRAILRYYKLNPLVNINDQFEIILKNSKTGYTVKPEQNRISDFVLKEVFTGIKK